MSGLKVSFEALDLPLANPFGISRRTTTVARNVLVRAEWDGLVGYGEAAPNAEPAMTRAKRPSSAM